MNKNKDQLNKLTGKVSLLQVLPFSLQQILAMFVTNMVPIGLVAAAAPYLVLTAVVRTTDTGGALLPWSPCFPASLLASPFPPAPCSLRHALAPPPYPAPSRRRQHGAGRGADGARQGER